MTRRAPLRRVHGRAVHPPRPVRHRRLVGLAALGVLLGTVAAVVAAPARAGACTDGRTAPWCTTTTLGVPTSSSTTSTPRPVPTTTRYGYDIVIPDPPTTTVQVIDLPPVDVESRAARAPEPATPVVVLPRFAG